MTLSMNGNNKACPSTRTSNGIYDFANSGIKKKPDTVLKPAYTAGSSVHAGTAQRRRQRGHSDSRATAAHMEFALPSQ